MISKKYRFHGRNSLKFLFGCGQTLKTDFFILRHITNRRRENFRLAIIVSKKVDKKAVTRNRIRRRLYELFRIRLSGVNLKADIAIIVLNNSLAEMPADQLRKLFEPAFKRLLDQYHRQTDS